MIIEESIWNKIKPVLRVLYRLYYPAFLTGLLYYAFINMSFTKDFATETHVLMSLIVMIYFRINRVLNLLDELMEKFEDD